VGQAQRCGRRSGRCEAAAGGCCCLLTGRCAGQPCVGGVERSRGCQASTAGNAFTLLTCHCQDVLCTVYSFGTQPCCLGACTRCRLMHGKQGGVHERDGTALRSRCSPGGSLCLLHAVGPAAESSGVVSGEQRTTCICACIQCVSCMLCLLVCDNRMSECYWHLCVCAGVC
jgi:hypothetical protein